MLPALTGELTCDITQAYAYHFYDIEHACWDAVLRTAWEFRWRRCQRWFRPWHLLGGDRPAAAEMGLVAGIPVIAGGLDAAVGALGAGVVRLGKTVDQGGQAGGMLMSVDRVIVEPLLIFGHHVLPGQYLLQSGTVGGGALGWFREHAGPAREAPECLSNQMSEEAARRRERTG